MIRRRNHLGVLACLGATLLSGIAIGVTLAGSDRPEQVYLDNAAPDVAASSETADGTETTDGQVRQERAPLARVHRPTSPPSASPRQRPTSTPSRSERNSIPGELAPDGPGTVLGPDGGSGTPDLAALESQVVRLINAERRRAGCAPLRVDARLTRSARAHSVEMAAANLFSHDSPDGSSPWQRMERAGYRDGGAENIGRGYQTAAAAVRGWMASAPHRRNILNCRLTAVGVGAANGPGGLWWTQDFGYS